jgi:hypothetical protein
MLGAAVEMSLQRRKRQSSALTDLAPANTVPLYFSFNNNQIEVCADSSMLLYYAGKFKWIKNRRTGTMHLGRGRGAEGTSPTCLRCGEHEWLCNGSEISMSWATAILIVFAAAVRGLRNPG